VGGEAISHAPCVFSMILSAILCTKQTGRHGMTLPPAAIGADSAARDGALERVDHLAAWADLAVAIGRIIKGVFKPPCLFCVENP
jgi:hypothetical protein